MTNETDPGTVGAANTDRELWREQEGDYYANSIHATKDGAIGINVGGRVIVKPLAEWHRLAAQSQPAATVQEVGRTGTATGIVAGWEAEWLDAEDEHWGSGISWASAHEIAKRLDAALPMTQSEQGLLRALADHNDALRSAYQVAEREGKDTNWLTLRGNIIWALAEHHDTVNVARAALTAGPAAKAGDARVEERKFYRSEWSLHQLLEARDGGLVTDDGEAWRYRYSHKDAQGEYDVLYRPTRQIAVAPPSPQPDMGGGEAFNLSTSDGGRGFIAEYFARELKRHDFSQYIKTRLAADFACALARHLSALSPPASQSVEKMTKALSDILTKHDRTERYQHLGEGNRHYTCDAVEVLITDIKAALSTLPHKEEATPAPVEQGEGARECGVMFGGHGMDRHLHGMDQPCPLPSGHDGPHHAGKWAWETDLACNCDDCQTDEPANWCVIFWEREAITTLGETGA